MESVAPVLLGQGAGKSSEMLPVVDRLGFVVGQAARDVCHDGSKYLHPVVHLHVLNRSGYLYLQRRSADKKLLPLYWDTAVGGHVGYGELMEEALYREAAEELGFYDFNPQGIHSYVFESDIENELVNVYAAVGDFDIHPDNYEVCDGRYWSMEEIEKEMGNGVLTPNFEMEFRMLKDKLLALL